MTRSVNDADAMRRDQMAEKAAAELKEGVNSARACLAQAKSRLGGRSPAPDPSSVIENFSTTSRARAYAGRNPPESGD
jgi:hypothetical protein